jgi:hypothetical protein
MSTQSKRLFSDSKANASFAFAAVFILLSVTGSSAIVAQTEKSSGEFLAAKLEAETVRQLPAMISSESEMVIQSAAMRALASSTQPINLPDFQEKISKTIREHFSSSYPISLGSFSVDAAVANISTSYSSVRDTLNAESPKPGGIVVSLQVGVKAKSESASLETTVEISKEVQTSAPYLSNQLEHVNSCAKTDGELERIVNSILSQLVQLRVIQGFGAPGHRQGLGLSSILTGKDVEFAVNLAFLLLEKSEFGDVDPLSWEALSRSSGNVGQMINLTSDWFSGSVDPFKTFLLLKGGSVDAGVNLRDFALQVLYSLVDQVVVQYLEYSHMIDIANSMIETRALLDDGWHSLVLALTGIDSRLDEALDWVSTKLSSVGVPDCVWRDIFSGSEDVSFKANSSTVQIFDRQGRLSTIVIGGAPFSIDLPSMSILRSETWKEFVPELFAETISTGDIIERLVTAFCIDLASTIPAEYIAPTLSSPESVVKGVLDRIQTVLKSLRPTDFQISGAASSISPYDEGILSLRDFINRSWNSLFPIGEAVAAGKVAIAQKLSDTAVSNNPAALPDGWKEEVKALVLRGMNSSSQNGWVKCLNNSILDYSKATKHAVIMLLDDALSSPPSSPSNFLSGTIVKWIADGVPISAMIAGLNRQTEMIALQISNLTREFSTDEKIDVGRPADTVLVREMFKGNDRNDPGRMTVIPRLSNTPVYLQKFEVAPSPHYSIENADPAGRLCVSIISPTYDGRERPRSVHYTSSDLFTSFPYETNWIVEARGIVKVAAGDRLSPGLLYQDAILIDLEIPITAVSGWPIDGVEYDRSNTLLGDAGELLNEVKNRIWPFISPLFEAFQKAIDFLTDALSELSRYISAFVERVTKVLSDFGNWLVSICKEIVDKIRSSPIWKFIELHLDLFGKAEARFKYGPVTVIVSCSLPDLLFRKAKDLVRVIVVTDLKAIRVSMGFRIAKLSDGGIDIVANSTVVCNDLTISLRVDPLMAIRDHLFEIDGYWKGLHVEAWGPEVNDYQEASACLSDIPGIGVILSDIPIPVLGISISIDAGFILKYRSPITDRLSINEVELNPRGSDSGHEWVELYNPLDREIDVDGYSLETTHGEIAFIELSGTVPANGYRAFTFSRVSLDNGDPQDSFAKGDAILLRAPSGRALDVTPLISDTANDQKTWHRRWDGGPKWEFGDNSKGKSNGNPLIRAYPDLLTKICFDSLMLAFEDEKDNVSASIEFVKNLIASFLRELIGQVADFAASLVTGADLFIDIGINDLSGSAGGGFRFRVHVDGDIIRQMIIWFAEQLAKIFGRILWDKEVSLAMKGKLHPAEAIYVGFDAYIKIGTPEWLSCILDTAGIMGEIRLACSFLMNLATLGPLFGRDLGSYCIVFGLHLDGLPGEDLLEPLTIKSDKVDVWLLKGRLIPA